MSDVYVRPESTILPPGRYSYLLTDEGVFIDDLIIYKIMKMNLCCGERVPIDDDASWIKRHISDETEFLMFLPIRPNLIFRVRWL